MKYLTLVLLVIASTASVIAGPVSSIRGTLVGYNGEPMPMAHVHVARSLAAGPIASGRADTNGQFELHLSERGLFLLMFSGVGHESHTETIALEPGDSVQVEARLATAGHPERFDSLRIIGDFNEFVTTSGREMQKQKDGSFVAVVPSGGDSLVYQVVYNHRNPSGFLQPVLMSGTQTDTWRFDSQRAYKSVLAVSDSLCRIVFDPKKLLREDTPASARFSNDRRERFADVFRAMDRRRKKMMAEFAEFQKLGNWEEPFSMDWSAEKAALLAAVESETDELLRHAKYIALLDLSSLGMRDSDAELAVRAIEEIPPTSILWSHQPMLISMATRTTGDPEMYGGYLEIAMDDHPDPDLRSSLLFSALMQAAGPNGSPERQRSYYTRLVEGHPETAYARMAVNQFNPDRKIAPGKDVPAFELPLLDKPGETVSRESMMGSFYLLDFWATWCKPCLEQMESLHDVYDKYKSQDFHIISLSFDQQASDVVKFRRKKWKMPWLHSFVKGGLNNDLAGRFELQGIPKPILVDPLGRIIAVGDELNGAFLDLTLQRYLNVSTEESSSGGE